MSEVCHYCGSSWEIQNDHKYPGGNVIIPACRRCNQSKSDSSPAQWLDRISNSSDSDDRYRWRVIRDWNYGRSNWFAQLVHARE